MATIKRSVKGYSFNVKLYNPVDGVVYDQIFNIPGISSYSKAYKKMIESIPKDIHQIFTNSYEKINVVYEMDMGTFLKHAKVKE